MNAGLTRPKIIAADDSTVTLDRHEWQSFVEASDDLASMRKQQGSVRAVWPRSRRAKSPEVSPP
jgi:ABC-type lipoprotein export system ATPase subunit